MKSKLSSQKAQIKIPPVPMPNPKADQGEEIPPGMKFIAKLKNKTHTQMLATVFPAFADAMARGDIKQIEGTAGLFSGFGLDLGVAVPKWAKAASMKFWDGIGFNFLTTFQGQELQIGKMVGLFDLAANPSKPDQAVQVLSKDATQGVHAIAKLEKTEAVNSSPDEHFEFAKGRKEAAKIVGKVQGMSQRAKIFQVIACAWREVEKFESAGQLHRWLSDNKVITSGTDSAETRKVCKIIGLQLRDKAGRPTKQK